VTDGYVRLGLIGDPVAHSLSPSIHAALLRERGIDGTYDAFRVPAGGARRALMRLRSADYSGINVTTPLKEEAAEACDLLDGIALEAHAVNTIVIAAGKLIGTTTDGLGAQRCLENALGSVQDAWLLVLGAGPTARASIAALKAAGAHVVVWNRTESKARALAERYGVRLWDRSLRADAALSALPPHIDPPHEVRLALATCPAIVDANYGPRATLAAALDRPVIDGLAMLNASACASFEIWMDALAAS
jgi:shikimate dehydrogenase